MQKLFDTHCHFDSVDDARSQLPRAYSAGVRSVNVIGCDLETTKTSIDVVRMVENEREALGLIDLSIMATVGLHPHEASHLDSQKEDLEALVVQNQDVIAGIGETGYDFYYNHSSKDDQTRSFSWQASLAKDNDLAMVIHTRDAWDETFSLLSEIGWPKKSVLHCFTGGPDEALKAVENGAYISISGISTFKNAQDIRIAIEKVPLNRLLIETDAPWLAPVPHRGKPNEPAYVSYVADEIVRIRLENNSEPQDENREEILKALYENAVKLFR